jgi:hypothetical protein
MMQKNLMSKLRVSFSRGIYEALFESSNGHRALVVIVFDAADDDDQTGNVHIQRKAEIDTSSSSSSSSSTFN